MVDDETRATRAAAGDPTMDGKGSGFAATEPKSEPAGEETIVPTWGAGDFVSLPDPGYQLGALIGHGGMGEVVAAHDQRIGRDVAVKRIRAKAPSPDVVTRFLREARIQARLDHPSIVPVYEVGTEADGRPFFTMKRLDGETLGAKLARGGPVAPLLRAFVDVCFAIDRAHARGVVHRDLKPSNIMIGDSNDVYVLDWGVARVLTDRRRATHPGMPDDVRDDGTTAGAILGTPGFMAPEQIEGHEVSPRTDVYALGSILFEILAGQALHPRGEAALSSTLTNPQQAPARRASERTIPPELDSACFEALSPDPDQRPTARELAERVQAYLDGDRDLERRRAMAAEQLAAARAALESSEDGARENAVRLAGHALALDPSSRECRELVTRLIIEPPAKLSPELERDLELAERRDIQTRSWQGTLAYASVFLFALLVPFLDVKNWTLALGFFAMVGLLVMLTLRVARSGRRSLFTAFVLNTASLLVFSRIASSFVLTPVVIMAVFLWYTGTTGILTRRRVLVGWLVFTVMLPIVLEWVHVLPKSWSVHDDALVVTSDFYYLHGKLEEISLVVANLGFMLIGGWFALAANRARYQAQRKVHIQNWHLRHLLPETKR
ncbi:MAG TPA: serine/threonine-protein kinase [Kofleriaceae bacterium]|nr:serine/threonine-protein kinase [Kofleriaceae bacterium]